ncbi:MAG: FAD-dependent oxidoreductase, partial [Gluconacetobacter diazotrophicus]|nr:FAD-dependent oxidoreductase [Gluconacetobacter diazotrophicus]
MADRDRFRLVIVGGGVAGLEIATRLGRSLGRSGAAEITLVDRGLSHVWKPMLHTIAAGTAHPDREKIGFLAQAARNGFRFHPGALESVDRANRVLHLGGFDDGSGSPALPAGRELGYDALVLAVGSRANDFGTPGVKEHAVFLDSLPEADGFFIRFRRALVEAMEAARPFDLAIVGGGATGVELAAEIKHALDAASRYD